MSKAALALLGKTVVDTIEIKKGRFLEKVKFNDATGQSWIGESKRGFREQALDKNKQLLQEQTPQEVAEQLKLQIKGLDKKDGLGRDILIENNGGYLKAADAFIDKLNSLLKPAEKEAAKDIPGCLAVVSTFGTLKDRLGPASDAAAAVLNDIIGADKKIDKPFSPDHALPNSEIRFSSALYKAVQKTNPTFNAAQIKATGDQVLLDLATIPRRGASQPLINKKTYTRFLESFAQVTSHYTQNYSTKEFAITVGAKLTPRSRIDNEAEGNTIVQAAITELSDAAKQLAGKTDWAAQEASDSYIQMVMKQLNNAAVKAGASGKVQRLNTQSARASQKRTTKVKTEVIVQKPVVAPMKIRRPTAPAVKMSNYSLSTLAAYINSRLPEVVRSNMGPENLVNRSGAFAASTRVVGVSETEQGFPSIAYTYRRNPYSVFEPTIGAAPWNKPSRDPRPIIEKSVREITRDLAIGRFYMRRV